MLGKGTIESPFIIQTPNDLNNVRNNLTASYELGNDIYMSYWGNFEPIGNSSNRFKGILNGKGFKIKNLTINKSAMYIGLISFLDKGIIKNLAVVDANVTSNDFNYVGILVGYTLNNAKILNCYTTGQVYGQFGIGGLVGYSDGIIENSYSHANVTGKGRIGGLVGNGLSSNSIIDKSFSNGIVTIKSDTNLYAGGLVGSHTVPSVVTNSFWDMNTSGLTISEGGEGKTSREMKTQSTFIGWDFDNTWMINNDYPRLKVFDVPIIENKQIINVSSSINSIKSNLSNSKKLTRQSNAFMNSLVTNSKRFTAVLRLSDGYLSQIETKALVRSESGKNDTRYINNYISQLCSNIIKNMSKRIIISSNIRTISSDLSVNYTTNEELFMINLNALKNASRVVKVEGNSITSYIINPSNLEVKY